MPTHSTDHSPLDFVLNATGRSSILLVCEHATPYIPLTFNGLGLSELDQKSHAAWDIGAIGLTKYLSQHLNAVAIVGAVSRLVYDCNRPPYAPDAMPERSEIIDIPGNKNLSQADRDARITTYYTPFHAAVSAQVAKTRCPIIVTIHSFTPVYHGQKRDLEIGILHDTDSRLADAMLESATHFYPGTVQRNAPYGPEDGVTHTLQTHALPAGLPNVMLEIRNDLITTDQQQKDMAQLLAQWIAQSCANLAQATRAIDDTPPAPQHCRTV
ncbi:putative N-formylglutamate amidohydrolase [Pacificibacter maritimus]|uniref:Putative N-formylglutamate amidohydrolase n=1 Tax=Pacificibacter maritimus TaxID=762213 RepID=A0A3N4UMV3_9RHOB|nr:N-formylglutamate amidohydrolase [Pacificibacter maritimus]RPE71986.1 putative N-formylglutamate amidohydrolase [Pacificibacter maritimus]